MAPQVAQPSSEDTPRLVHPLQDYEEVKTNSAMYHDLTPHEPNAVFHIADRYRGDKAIDERINVSIGAYRDPVGRPYLFKVVVDAEEQILQKRREGYLSHDYPPIGGSQLLVTNSAKLVFGGMYESIKDNMRGIQAPSGTGALRVVGEFLARSPLPGVDAPDAVSDVGFIKRQVYISNPTWPNHKTIFQASGFEVKQYRYFDDATHSLNFEGMLEDLNAIPEYNVVVLHACAHNPTGVDPNLEQWRAIAEVCKRRNLLVVFDLAYLGFASGDTDEDAFAVRLFADMNIEFFVCQSYSKNLGIYDERTGVAMYVSNSPAASEAVVSHLKTYSRWLWSVPPMHGAHIVNTVMESPEIIAKWKQELTSVASRIRRIREELFEALTEAVPERTWNHIVEQRGMFSYTGLSKEECEELMDHHHIYLMKSGRISISGIPDGRVKYFAEHVAHAIAIVKARKESAEAQEQAL